MDLDYDSYKLINAKEFSFGSLKGRNVVVIGGGDTGNDCVGTSVRLGAANVVQLEMMPKPPECRAASNPWPEWPKILKTDYGQLNAIDAYGNDPRIYETTVTEFLKDKAGKLTGVKTVKLTPKRDEATGRMNMVPLEGTEKVLKVDLVLIAAGFLGGEGYIREDFGVECDGRTNITGTDFATSRDRVFAAGDCHRGQSLVVWAIAEGRRAAAAVDRSLMGYTNLC